MKYFNTSFFKITPDLFFLMDANFSLMEINPSLEKILGGPLQKSSTKTLFDFIHVEDVNETRLAAESLTELNPVLSIRVRLIIRGIPRLHNLTLTYDQEIKCIFGSAKDDSTDVADNFFRSTLDSLPMMVSYVDKKLTYLYANEAYKKYFKIISNEYIGKGISELMDSQIHIMLILYFELALKGKQQTIEFMLPKSESLAPFSIVNIILTPTFNSSAEVEGIYIYIHDITELKTSASIAIEKEKKLNALFNNLTQGVVLQNANGKIIEFNQSALNILKLNKDQLLGKSSHDPYWRVVNEDLVPITSDQHPAVITLKTGQPVLGKVMGVYISDTELSWMSVNSVPLFTYDTSTPSEVLVTFEDLTRTKKLKKELQTKTHWQEAILNGSECLIISTYPDGTIATFNKKAEQLLGHKAHEVVNNFTPAIFHLEQEVIDESLKLSVELKRPISPSFETFIAKALLNGSETKHWTYVAKDKSTFKVKLCVTAIFDESRNCIGYLGVADLL